MVMGGIIRPKTLKHVHIYLVFKAISFVGQCCVVSREILSKKDALFSHFDRQRSIENWMQRSTFTKADPVLPGWSCQFKEKADTGISVKYIPGCDKELQRRHLGRGIRRGNETITVFFCRVANTVLWEFPTTF